MLDAVVFTGISYLAPDINQTLYTCVYVTEYQAVCKPSVKSCVYFPKSIRITIDNAEF